ncbi:TrmB family transcriptional regulator sugar-binding domain-containing protein [Halomicroarcula sp. GCM10025709]|uniref:TrmB family transcriptional regulator sugar-binding domain-containing protein n=1 Tax=Halomicroarcula sp. GCM10025709 TaxID=3252669 RepID=UPI0036210F17
MSLVQRAQTVFEKAEEELDHALDYVQAVLSVSHLDALQHALASAHDRNVFVDLTVYDAGDDALSDYDCTSLCTQARAISHPLRSDPFGVLVDRRRACYSWHQETDEEHGIYVDDSAHENMIWHYMTTLQQAATEVYVETPYETPLRFGSLRDCLAVIEPLVRDGVTLSAEVTGESVATGRERREVGTVEAIDYPGFETGASPTPQQTFAEATLTLSTDHETYSIGGFDARTEDIEATRIVVTELHG